MAVGWPPHRPITCAPKSRIEGCDSSASGTARPRHAGMNRASFISRTSCRTTRGRRCSPAAGTAWSGCFLARSSVLSRMWSGQTWSQQPSTNSSFRAEGSACTTMSTWGCCTSITQSVSSALPGWTAMSPISTPHRSSREPSTPPPRPSSCIPRRQTSSSRRGGQRLSILRPRLWPPSPMCPTILRAYSAVTWLYRCRLRAGRNCRGHRVNACGGSPPPSSRMRLVTAFPLWRGTLPVMQTVHDDSRSYRG